MCSAPSRSGKSFGCNCHNQGGKSDRNLSRLRFVRAVYRGVSFKIHWRLSLFHFRPRPLLIRPLSTTFVHILRLSCLLSITNLLVHGGMNGFLGKLRQVVANRSGDHKRLRLRKRFVERESFDFAVSDCEDLRKSCGNLGRERGPKSAESKVQVEKTAWIYFSPRFTVTYTWRDLC